MTSNMFNSCFSNENKERNNLLKSKDVVYYEELITFPFNSIIGRPITSVISNLFGEQSFDHFYITPEHSINIPSSCFYLQASRLPIILFFKQYYNKLQIKKELHSDKQYSELNAGLFYKMFPSKTDVIYHTYDMFIPFIIENNSTVRIIEKDEENFKKFLFAKTYPSENNNIMSKGIFLSTLTDIYNNNTLIKNIYNQFKDDFTYDELLKGSNNNKGIIYKTDKSYTNIIGYEDTNNQYFLTVKIQNYLCVPKSIMKNIYINIIDETFYIIKDIIENNTFLTTNIVSNEEIEY